MTDQQIKTYNQFEPKSIEMIIERLPHVSYFCTSVSLPGLSSASARFDTPHTTAKIHGDSSTFQPLIVNFILDEKLINWKEIVDWIWSYTHPTDYDEYKANVSQRQLHQTKYSDILIQLTNNKYNISHEFKFVDAFPIDITDVIIDIQNDGTVNTIVTVTFDYTYYKMIS